MVELITDCLITEQLYNQRYLESKTVLPIRWLNHRFPDYCKGWRGTIEWPSRSPYLVALIFSARSCKICIVYKIQPTNLVLCWLFIV